MENKTFKFYNRLVATIVFLISATIYLLTIEPTASFWDCGEFIASSYKLEIGHPPGNPVFQLIARFFTIFVDNTQAAIAVNAMNAICSALTIFLLYLTIVFLGKRLVSPDVQGRFSLSQSVAIFGSAAIGALVYCFSDTFWFSAVEGEVYAMSSLFTALVFWAMTKWYDEADKPYANRWIVLISFLMGLSIGIHLLNLLAIPALVFMFYYKKREQGTYSFKEMLTIFGISVLIIAIILFGIIPYLPKIAAYFDLLAVNVLGLPFNVGAIFFMLTLFVLCFWGIIHTYKKGKVFWNTTLLCFTMIIIGFSLFSIVVIRSSVKTPTNEYQPDNPFTLVRYLGREQYGSNPLVYGQYFDAPVSIEPNKFWTPLNGKYIKTEGMGDAKYDASGKMFFPRMWNGNDPRYVEFYKSYMDERGHRIPNAKHKKPTFRDNLTFFFDFQMNWMYWRYFMWNFVGRQNDFHSPTPGELFNGNWESGIGFIDEIRLGDQSSAPGYLKDNKGKNHYYFLPLLLGIIGIFFQFSRDKRGAWLTFLMFFMTGIAIVIYLNQPPFQVRERDYAYAGSFYSFCIWIGFAALAIYSSIEKLLKDSGKGTKLIVATATSVLGLAVPALMAEQNWDDHDRSNRYTSVEIAKNYLNSAGKNGILITHGDNDTFPLWYAQEVENVRTDVRICNTSLLGTDWHIDQMKYACNESKPLDLSIGMKQYLYGTNEYVIIYDTKETVLPISEVLRIFKHPEAKLKLESGKAVNVIISRKMSVPVNKENVIKYGILDAKYADIIPDEIIISIPKNKDYLTKPELFMLDLLANYQWDRPLNLLSRGGDINMGIKDYLMYDGFSYRFIPIKNKNSRTEFGFVDTDDLYHKMTEVYKWDALKKTDYFVDYQNLYTFCGVMPQREIFVNVATKLLEEGKVEKATKMLDMAVESVPEENFPLVMSYLGFSNELNILNLSSLYFEVGQPEKGYELLSRFSEEILGSAKFFLEFYEYAKDDFDRLTSYMYYAVDILNENGMTKEAKEIEDKYTRTLVD